MLNLSKQSSETINSLKCFLSIGVVMIHAKFSIDPGIYGGGIFSFNSIESFEFLRNLIDILLMTCVPLFFFISGYLFFLNMDINKFSLCVFVAKWKKRVRSLLIPYIIGNLLILLLYLLAETYLGDLFSGSNKPVSSYGFREILQSFWCVEGWDAPINEVLWFLRELMVMLLLSPLFMLLAKYTRNLYVFGFGMLFVFSGRLIPGFRPESMFFYGLGAYMALYGYDIIAVAKRWWKETVCVYMILYIIAVASESSIVTKAAILFSFPAIVKMVSWLIEKKNIAISSKWITATFFIYIYHDCVIITIKKLFIKFINPTSCIECFMIYFGSILLTIAILLSGYLLLRKIAPRVLSVVVGGR